MIRRLSTVRVPEAMPLAPSTIELCLDNSHYLSNHTDLGSSSNMI